MAQDDLRSLLKRVEAATGRDTALDRDISRLLDQSARGTPVPDYTASVDQCLALIGRALPGWHWHLGYGANGVFPYASLANGSRRIETEATTVPLALLAAIVKARMTRAKP